MSARPELKISAEAFWVFVNQPENTVFPAISEESQTLPPVQA